MVAVPLSVIDLAVVSQGITSSQALNDTTKLAQVAEKHGFVRFWVAEHHNMSTVASTSPAVLIAHLAANTNQIRVGSGGVMLPNHVPLVIAEQFALLEALHPGRIDLGLGRAPGSDRYTAAALRRSTAHESVEDFPRDLIELMGLLDDPRQPEGLWDKVRATPNATSAPEVMLLGSSGFSAQLAGILGLPFAFANHFDMGGTLDAVEVYYSHFRPSPRLEVPYAIVSAAVICAADNATAQLAAAPTRLRKYGMRTGRFLPLIPPEETVQHAEWANASAMPSNSIVGTPEAVAQKLQQLAADTAASELMINTSTYSLAERITSLELTATAWQELVWSDHSESSVAAKSAADIDTADIAAI